MQVMHSTLTPGILVISISVESHISDISTNLHEHLRVILNLSDLLLLNNA